MLPQTQIRIQIQIQTLPTPVPAPRDGDVSTKSCQLVLPTILINVFYISTHFRIQVALKNVNTSKISTQIPIQACSLCILHFKVTVLYEYGYTKYTIIYCWTTWMTMCVQCTHSHKRIARECIVPQGNAQVVQRQRTSHTLYNKARHVAHVVQSKADKWSDRWTVRPLWGAASEKRESWRLPPLRPVLYFIVFIMMLENKMAMLWHAFLCILY